MADSKLVFTSDVQPIIPPTTIVDEDDGLYEQQEAEVTDLDDTPIDEPTTNTTENKSITTESNAYLNSTLVYETPSTEEEPETDDTNTETDSTNDDDATDANDNDDAASDDGDAAADGDEAMSEYSDAALMAKHFADNGWIDEDKNSIDKDLDYAGFEKQLTARFNKEVEAAKQQAIETVGKYQEYVDYLMKGGDPKLVQQAAKHNSIATLDLEDEANQELVMKNDLAAKELNDVEIEAVIERLKDKGQLKSRAEKIQNAHKDYRDNLTKQEETQRLEQEEAAKEHRKREIKSLQEIVSSGNIGGLEVDARQQQSIMDALLKPTEVVSYVNQSGKTVKTKVTLVQKLEAELNNNKEKQLQYVHFLLNGFSVDTAVQAAVEKKNRNMLDTLNSRTTKKSSKPSPSRNRKKNAYYNL